MQHRSGRSIFVTATLLAALLAGCAGSKPYTLGPVKTFDPDTAAIPMPDEREQYQYWDRIDNTIFHQIEKPLDLNKTFRFVGRRAGVAGARQADNINKLDEVPESSWYTKRHFYHHMNPEELKAGPDKIPPDTSGTWTVFQGKLEGANSGFFIEDERGRRYLIKFDGYDYPELTTAAEAISTRFFYAAGYHVPGAAIVYFDPDKVVVGDSVEVDINGSSTIMTEYHLKQILEGRPRNKNGKIRALASKFVNGIPVGPWGFEGTRGDDPNDRVKHEHRRELRGMRVISSWLNDTDRRDANTMSVYTDSGYIRHLVQDFGNTLGANGPLVHEPIYGQAYLIDPRYMALSGITLGHYIWPWERVNFKFEYPSVGYFRADVFKPGRWVPAHPIPPFENMTLRDAFWGAKHVTAFSDEDIRAIVKAGRLSNPEAEEYLVQTLIQRRDKIARYWYTRINPLDRFEPQLRDHLLTLRFDDLGVKSEVFDADQTSYTAEVRANGDETKLVSKDPSLKFDLKKIGLDEESGTPQIAEIELHTLRANREGAGKSVTVYVAVEDGKSRIAGIEREE